MVFHQPLGCRQEPRLVCLQLVPLLADVPDAVHLRPQIPQQATRLQAAELPIRSGELSLRGRS